MNKTIQIKTNLLNEEKEEKLLIFVFLNAGLDFIV